MRLRCRGLLCAATFCFIAVGLGHSVEAQTSLTGANLVLKSNGTATLNGSDYVGSYITVADSGNGGSNVNFTVNAAKSAGAGTNPTLRLSVADSNYDFNLNSTSGTDYSSGSWLPAGTYVVRVERSYTDPTFASASSLSAAVNSLTVNGATFSNSSTTATQNTNALAAANTYIQNFRKGNATVHLPGLAPGTQVQVDLSRIGFNFGTAVAGSIPVNVDQYMGSGGTAQQVNYQAHVLQNFNAIVPENAGKWLYNAQGINGSEMSGVDQILNFAQAHKLNVRMHNLIWGQQQPQIATSLISATQTDPNALSQLTAQINHRIDYYVGTGTASDRANKYVDLDVYNESYHTGQTAAAPNYWSLYGPTGIAQIYGKIHNIAPNVHLYVNEYNVLNNNFFDRYSNFYIQHINTLRDAGFNAGYGDVVGGIGTQFYANSTDDSPGAIMRVVQNLAVEGLPITLTEFGVNSGATSTQAASILSHAMQLYFGTPNAEGFFMWGFQAENSGTNLFAPAAALYQVNTSDWNTWTITDAGKVWQDMLGIQDWDGNPNDAWTTHVTATVGADGTIDFNGFYGDYNVTINGQTYDLDFTKGVSDYVLTVPEPSAIVLSGIAFLAAVFAKKRFAANHFRSTGAI
jgi:endo-1,4-beta-xylanase